MEKHVTLGEPDRLSDGADVLSEAERLWLTTNAVEIGWWDVEEGHGPLTWPPRVKAMFGISPDAPVTLEDFYSGLHPDDHDRVAAAYASATDPARRTSYEIEYRTVGKEDGVLRWVSARGRGLFDESGRCQRAVGTAIDITERKLAEEKGLTRQPEEADLRESEGRLRLAMEAARLTTWEYDVVHDIGSRGNILSVEFPRLPGSGFGQVAWFAAVHPEDRPQVEAAFRAAAEGRSPRFVGTFRLEGLDGTGWRWIEAVGAPVLQDSVTGQPLRLAGMFHDVTERKWSEQRQALLMRELDHRAKNLLAVVQAALRLTPKLNIEDYVTAVEGRVCALARTHALLAEGHWKGAGLRQLIESELAPFRSAANSSQQVSTPKVNVRGIDVMLAPAAAQAVSIALYELATNATKYGALSVPSGRVSVVWGVHREADLLNLRWTETKGPPLETSPAHRGFGSRVIEATLREQLGGRVDRRWETTGLVCEIVLPLARILSDCTRTAGTVDPHRRSASHS